MRAGGRSPAALTRVDRCCFRGTASRGLSAPASARRSRLVVFFLLRFLLRFLFFLFEFLVAVLGVFVRVAFFALLLAVRVLLLVVLGAAVLVLAFLRLFGLFLFECFFVCLDDLAVADLAAPAFRFVGGEHGVAQEVLQIQAQSAALGTPQIAGLLEQPGGVVLDDDDNAGQRRGQFVEGDAAAGRSLGA